MPVTSSFPPIRLAMRRKLGGCRGADVVLVNSFDLHPVEVTASGSPPGSRASGEQEYRRPATARAQSFQDL